ncbi:MAG: protein TolA, partial [Marinobacter sp.]
MRGHERDVTNTGQPPWKSPVALSILLHGLILGVALAGWTWTDPSEDPPPPSISARLITPNEPEPSPVTEPVDEPDRDEERRQEEERKRKEEAERRKAEEEREREEARRIQQEK